MYRLAICFVTASLVLAAPRPGAADASILTVFDTVDSVEIQYVPICSTCSANHSVVMVRGIRSGSSTPTTSSFDFGQAADIATRCGNLAVIAMSKPGKYQFGIGADTSSQTGGLGGHGDCKLILVTP
jgi:hypothetical protein